MTQKAEKNIIENVPERNHFSFKRYAWAQFKKNKAAFYSFRILIFLVILAVIAPFIATDLPLYCKYKGVSMFPAFSFSNNCEVTNPESGEKENIQYDIAEWKKMDVENIIFAPVPYTPNKTDYDNANYVSPGGKQIFTDKDGNQVDMPSRFRHRLGTNKGGEDVLSGLINGTRVSLTIGILSMSIASALGLLLGAMAGYFGDRKLQTTRGAFWTFIVGTIFAWYYAFYLRSYSIADGFAESSFSMLGQLLLSLFIFSTILYLFYLIGKVVGKLPFLNSNVYIPVDSIISRCIEILISMPLLILIISVAAIAKEKSIINIMVIIGLTGWTPIARLTRAEFLRVSNLEYIHAAKSMGFKEFRIIFKHALPNAIAPALVAIAFGVASAILIESSLSFLGVGVPPSTVTWGSLLNSGREQYSAWWLVIFPGLAIFLTVTIYNLLGEGLRDALDPRLKR
ncbi:MAG: binding-protein-dependent transport system inner rane component [Bacteroidota bacterium]|jgi:peptide/nickel transport system permease protein|nr:binding-protein-dependent transport system inner rane component [Bacteroidota bacterium]